MFLSTSLIIVRETEETCEKIAGRFSKDEREMILHGNSFSYYRDGEPCFLLSSPPIKKGVFSTNLLFGWGLFSYKL